MTHVADGTGQGRRRASRILAVLGALTLLFGAFFLYARQAIFSPEGFANRAVNAVEDQRVRDPLAEAIVDQLIENAEPDLVNGRPVLISVTSGVIGSRAFESVLRQAAERAHRTIFTRERDALVLSIADGTALAADGLSSVSPELAKKLPQNLTTKLNDLIESKTAVALVAAAEDVRFLGLVLPIVALILLVAAAWVDRDRRRSLLAVAISVAACFGVGLALLLVGRALALASAPEEFRDAGAAIWDAYLGGLRTWMFVGLGGSLLLAAAVSTSRRIDAADPLRRLVGALGRPVGRAARAWRAIALLGLGIVIILSPAVVPLPARGGRRRLRGLLRPHRAALPDRATAGARGGRRRRPRAGSASSRRSRPSRSSRSSWSPSPSSPAATTGGAPGCGRPPRSSAATASRSSATVG